ncbi:hypothetical protein LLG95_18530 [bacterium]|nr:hypothetical protein [bacterium]
MLGILLLIFAWVWVAEIVRRLGSDIAEFRNAKEFSERLVLIVIWIITLFFVAVILSWARLLLHAIMVLIKAAPALVR